MEEARTNFRGRRGIRNGCTATASFRSRDRSGDYRYRIYFSPRDRQIRSNVSWLDIDIRNPTEILRLSQQPLLTPGASAALTTAAPWDAGWWSTTASNTSTIRDGTVGVTVGFYVAVGVAERPRRRSGSTLRAHQRRADPRSLYGGAGVHRQSGRTDRKRTNGGCGISPDVHGPGMPKSRCRPTTFATPIRPTAVQLETRGASSPDIRAPRRGRDRALLSVAGGRWKLQGLVFLSRQRLGLSYRLCHIRRRHQAGPGRTARPGSTAIRTVGRGR